MPPNHTSPDGMAHKPHTETQKVQLKKRYAKILIVILAYLLHIFIL